MDALPFAGAISGLTISAYGDNFRVTIFGFRLQYSGCVVNLSGAFSGVAFTFPGCIRGVVMLIRMGMGGQLSGSVGGVVASHNKGGQYLRNRSIPVNPNSVAQQLVRATFSAAAIDWAELTVAQRAAWEAYAVETPVLNRLGESITVAGFNMFTRWYAFSRRAVPDIVLLAAPTTPGLVAIAATFNLAAGAVAGLTPADVGTAVDGPYIIALGPPVSPGVKFFAGPFTAYVVGPDLATQDGNAIPPNVTPLRYGPLLAGQRRFFRVAGSSADGKLSNSVIGVVTVGA